MPIGNHTFYRLLELATDQAIAGNIAGFREVSRQLTGKNSAVVRSWLAKHSTGCFLLHGLDQFPGDFEGAYASALSEYREEFRKSTIRTQSPIGSNPVNPLVRRTGITSLRGAMKCRHCDQMAIPGEDVCYLHIK